MLLVRCLNFLSDVCLLLDALISIGLEYAIFRPCQSLLLRLAIWVTRACLFLFTFSEEERRDLIETVNKAEQLLSDRDSIFARWE